MTSLENFEKKIIDNLIEALSNEYQKGTTIKNKLENLILIIDEVGTEDMGCYGLYVNNDLLVSLSEEEIASRFKHDNNEMFSANRFQHEVYSDEDVWELSKILEKDYNIPDDLKENPAETMTYYILRICAKLEHNKMRLGELPLGNNFMIFVCDADDIDFDLRRQAKDLYQLPIEDYLKIISQ